MVPSAYIDVELTPSELQAYEERYLFLLLLLRFDQARRVGTVFHMLSALAEHGRVGMTSVGDSPDEAQTRYDEVVEAIAEASERTGR